MNFSNILEEVKIEGLSSLKSLKLNMKSIERFSLNPLNESIDIEFNSFRQTPFDKLDNLKFSKAKESLTISFSNKPESFHSDLIDHLFKQINELTIYNANDDNIAKLLSNQTFPNLKELTISLCYISRIESKMFNGSFPMLQKLTVKENIFLRKIDRDAFSGLNQLTHLDISYNSIASIDPITFSQLENLESLSLISSRLRIVDANMFSNLKKLKSLQTYPSVLIRSPLNNNNNNKNDDEKIEWYEVVLFFAVVFLIIFLIRLVLY